MSDKLVKPDDYKEHEGCSCGAADAIFDYVPDTVYGLNIKKACCIHDFMYTVGLTRWDKERADRVFLENMLHLIAAGTKWKWLLWLRKERAYKYYQAVVKFGAHSFWDGKGINAPKEEDKAA